MHGLYIFAEINLAKFAEIGDKQAQNCSFIENEIINSVDDVCSINQANNEAIYRSYILYACLVAGNFIFGIFVSIAFYQLVIIATRNVHDIALAGLLKSPMRFFNINPPGRLLNRFAQDLGKIDEHFPVCSEETLTVLLQLVGLFCVAMWANWFRPGNHIFLILWPVIRIGRIPTVKLKIPGKSMGKARYRTSVTFKL